MVSYICAVVGYSQPDGKRIVFMAAIATLGIFSISF